ncbi:MAG: PDZ domain-containing protein [Chitinophagaceae bacterium]
MAITKTFHAASTLLFALLIQLDVHSQGTRLLRQPSISNKYIAFEYGADIWIVAKNGGEARRITSTQAVEADPHFSPDGLTIAFTSNRSGVPEVYTVSIDGGTPTRLTWFPAQSYARGWSPDGKNVLYASTRETAPTDYCRLWTVPAKGGPSMLLSSPFGFDGSYSPDGKNVVVDRVSRWDVEWREYRGGQNTALQILNLGSLAEKSIPNDRTFDIQPVWAGNTVYFLSDRDDIMNIWSFDPANDKLTQVTKVKHTDIKWLDGNDKELVYELNGYLHLLDIATGKSQQLAITVSGDFPWAETKWEDVSTKAASPSLSPTGKRILVEARGEIFTVPVENGDVRNLTHSSGVADRRPLWSPDGKQIAWFSDAGGNGYALRIANQDGSNTIKTVSIGDAKLAWEPSWSPDSKFIAFADNKVRIKVLELATGKITTVDTGGLNIERGNMGITWSPDSKWLAYAKTAANNFRRINVWSMESNKKTVLTDAMADATSPAWDRDGRYLYFLASTSIALGSGWANTSSMTAKPSFGAYIAVLRKDDPTPFPLKSDEEPDSTAEAKKAKDTTAKAKAVRIDFDNIDHRILALPVPLANYDYMIAGPKGTVFIGGDNALSKFSIETKKLEDFAKGINDVAISANGEKILLRAGGESWRVVSTAKAPSPDEGKVTMQLKMELNRLEEWKQIFEEAYRYERDYFYDPNLHGRNWQDVWDRYSPLVPYIRHRSDLNYVLDQLGGELSVGHSFVFGGDFPSVEKSSDGLLGADLIQKDGRWQIKRIFTTESWNPGLSAPLAQPDLKVKEGDFIIKIDGNDLSADTDPYSLLDGKANKQTVLTINNKATSEGAWKITVAPIDNEDGLRQRAWVEDNRRKVEELSKGRLGYVWVPNTGGPGFVSFNRYYFAQQDKEGAVIDERFNGGGLLDDYMVDLMVRRLRASYTNEVPGGVPGRLPAGILGPKALLINEMAGSGGDFFPWAFRHQKVGPLIGTRTWGGLVKSSVHYGFIDGGAMTAPDNAIFDPIANKWIAENEGIAPDIEQKIDALSASKGRDVQLEKAVEEVLKLLEKEPTPKVVHPEYSKPARN